MEQDGWKSEFRRHTDILVETKTLHYGLLGTIMNFGRQVTKQRRCSDVRSILQRVFHYLILTTSECNRVTFDQFNNGLTLCVTNDNSWSYC